jgi:hypothetical protein
MRGVGSLLEDDDRSKKGERWLPVRIRVMQL